LFDTVYVSLYKYFNAAAGAVLAGPRGLIENLYHQRRMFGGSLRQAWPYAAVALHYLAGFGERFERAAASAETLFQALRQHPRCEVRRPAAATNVTRLRVFGADAESLPERLVARGIAIRPALHVSRKGAEFELLTNETILRRPAEEIIEIFIEALQS
jgi:threonine aldolase